MIEFPRVGCGGGGGPNRLFGEGCLSGEVALHLGASSRAILFGTEAEEPGGEWWAFDHSLEGRAQARMVLVTFAETKVTRLQGRNPA